MSVVDPHLYCHALVLLQTHYKESGSCPEIWLLSCINSLLSLAIESRTKTPLTKSDMIVGGFTHILLGYYLYFTQSWTARQILISVKIVNSVTWLTLVILLWMRITVTEIRILSSVLMLVLMGKRVGFLHVNGLSYYHLLEIGIPFFLPSGTRIYHTTR